MLRRIALVMLLTAGFIASCATAPPANKPVHRQITSSEVPTQRPVFIEFYSTL